MAKVTDQELLKDHDVIQEIERFKWIESERSGADIGFDIAAREWLEKFSEAWVSAHTKRARTSGVKARSYAAKKA